jgi:hypothetical protein
MIASLLTASHSEIACRIFRPQFLPGTGRGTASRRWRGRLKTVFSLSGLSLAAPGPTNSVASLVPGRI